LPTLTGEVEMDSWFVVDIYQGFLEAYELFPWKSLSPTVLASAAATPL